MERGGRPSEEEEKEGEGSRPPEEEEMIEFTKINLMQSEKPEYQEELKKVDRNNIHRLQHLKDELEGCRRQEISKLEETYLKEVNTKYKTDLEKDLTTADPEVDVEKVRSVIINLRDKLQVPWCKELENCSEDFLRESYKIELKYRPLLEEIVLQLTNAEEFDGKAKESKNEKECLHEIEKLNSFVQELSEKLLLEAEKNKVSSCKYDKAISAYNTKLKDLEEEETLLQQESERQKIKLEKMLNGLCQRKDELVDPNVEFSHTFRVSTLVNMSDDVQKNLKELILQNDSINLKSDNYLKDNVSQSELRAVEDTKKLDSNFARIARTAIFNNSVHLDHRNASLNVSHFKDILGTDSDKIMCFGEQISFDVLPETSGETDLNSKSSTFLAYCCLSQNEREEYKDAGAGEVDILKRDTDLMNQINVLDEEYQGIQENMTAEIVYVNDQESSVVYEECVSQRMEELEPKSKHGKKSDPEPYVEEYKNTMKDSISLIWEAMVQDLQQEKETLMIQLKMQEQLVKDVQEQKMASDSVTSEVQSLFGQQLAILQNQRDQMEAHINSQEARNKMLSELLGKKAVLEELLLKEQEDFIIEINNKEQCLSYLRKEKSALEEKVRTLDQSLMSSEKALEENLSKIMILEQTVDELSVKIEIIQESHELERLEFEVKLQDNNSEIEKLSTEIILKEKEYIVKENELREEMAHLKNMQSKVETCLEETQQKSVQKIEEIESEMGRLHKEEINNIHSQYQSELTNLKLQHQKTIEELNSQIKERTEQQQQLEAVRKEQIGIIKKVHEREHDREIGELIVQHEDEMKEMQTELMKEQQQKLDELQQHMETTHQEEMQQTEILHNLKLESLRLSANNIHTSQLELMQSNLRKEKETALMELREMLKDRHAQELAVLQGQYHFEVERIKEQNCKEKEEMALKHQHDLDNERKEITLKMEEKYVQMLENLKKECALKADIALKDMSEALLAKHEMELSEMKRTLEMEMEKLRGDLETLSLQKEQGEMEHKKLENQYHLAMKKLQIEHEQEVKEMAEQNKKQERELQLEVQKLQAESEQEIKQLWSQLDSARASRQELSELKEQLLARTSQMEEIECLKKDFQLKWDKKRSEHEIELEQLRVYFEQKLKSVEENYREELTMLHQRMEEAKDYSLLEIENSQEPHVDPSTTLLEEMTEKERRDIFDQLTQQLEHHKEELHSLQLHLDKKHRKELELLRSSLSLEHQENLMKVKMDLSDRYISEIEQLKRKHCLGLEQLRAKISEEHLREIAKLRLQCAQDAARQVEAEVAERLFQLENEYKAKLSDLQTQMRSVSIQQEEIEKLRKENIELKERNVLQEMHLKEEFEQIKIKLNGDHTAELRRNKEKIQELELLHKAKAEEWKQEREDLNIKNEEMLSLLHKDLENKTQCEKQALQRQFELEKAEMTSLQDKQAARIVELEKSLKEQQNNVQQLADSLANAQKTLSQYDSELASSKAVMTEELEKAKQVLQEEYNLKLKNAENRSIEESKAMTEKIKSEHEVLLQELRVKHVEELELQSKELHHKHKEEMLSLTLKMQTKHQAEIEDLKSALEAKRQTWVETYVASLQNDHEAQIAELDAKHLSELNTLESTYLSEIQLLQDEQKQALENLRMDLQKQLILKDKGNQMLLDQELDGMKQKYARDLKVCQDNLKIELATIHIEKLKTMAEELEEAHKEDLTIALENQRRLLEDDYHKSMDILQKEVLHIKEQHRNTIEELDSLHKLEVKKEKEKWQQLQKDMEELNSIRQQLEEKNLCLSKEIKDASTELQNLRKQQNRENQEGETLIALLKSDIELYKTEREKLQESHQQALKLLLKMMKSTKDAEDLICKKIGLCLDDSFASGDSEESQNMSEEIIITKKMKPMEKWSTKNNIRGGQGEGLALTLLEDSHDSLKPGELSELSEHLCESIFKNPDLVFANEERVHQICHCLHIAVEKLLDLVAESTKQLEEMHNIHLHVEEEFIRRNLEACQVANEHQELVGCLNEESNVKHQLMLELHKTKGLMDGYLAERHALQEALKLKEESECRLVLELESLKSQIQELKQKVEKPAEDQKFTIRENKVLTDGVGEREVDLIQEIEHLAKAKLEMQCQAEKDCSTLNAQIKMLEMELEEQISKNQNLTVMSLEVTDLRQQMQSLERQLKNQRDFMDKQAVEREHERDEFQEEIQKLEMELKLTAKFQASGQSNLVDTLYGEIKEKTEDFNRLFSEKEQIQKDLVAQKDQIKKLEAQIRELELKNKEETNHANQLTQELQKMKKMEAELKQDKEALQQQNHNNLIQISALHSKLDEVKHKLFTEWNSDHILNEQLKVQEELLVRKREITSLLEQLEQYKVNLLNKNEEVLQLSSKLEMERNANCTQIIQVKEENAHLKENIAKLLKSQNPVGSEFVVLQFLKSLLEEKNQETDHLNEQIMRLQCEIKKSKENEILESQALEIQNLKSIVECLHNDKEQLLKDKTEETEQLREIIETLQKELEVLIPTCQEANNSQNSINNFAVVEQNDIKNKMKEGSLSHQVNRGEDVHCIPFSYNQNQLQGQLEAVLADREALQQLLEEKKSQFKAETEILKQNLQEVLESSRQHFTRLTALQLQHEELDEEHKLLQVSLTQKDVEMTKVTICIQELEDKLRAKETDLLQKGLQLQSMLQQNSEQAVEAQQMKAKVVQLENEQHALLQALHDKEDAYQREVGKLHAVLAELKPPIDKKREELEILRTERDHFNPQLKTSMEKDQNNDNIIVHLNELAPDFGRFVSHKEVRKEEDREPNEKLSASPKFSCRDNSEKEIAASNLNAFNQYLNQQDKHLQSVFCVEEGKIINDDKEEQDPHSTFQQRSQLSDLSKNTQLMQKIPNNFQSMVMDETSWDSPEILRKENSLELHPGPFSDLDSSTLGSEGLCSENSVIQGITQGGLEWPVSYSYGNEEIGNNLLLRTITFPESTFSITEYDDIQENISVSNAEGFNLMPPDLQDDLRITMSRLEDASTEYLSNTCSDLVLQLNQEESKTRVQQDSSVMTYLQCFGIVPDITEPAIKEKDIFSQQLKNVLKMVYEESYKILVLSEKSRPGYDKDHIQKAPSVERWQRERLGLLDTVESLKDYLSKVPDKENKENASSFFDWRGELLQAIQCVLEKERLMFQSYLQSHFHNPGSGNEGTLVEKLERIMEQQEQQQKAVLEHLLSSDRNSLLTEIQDLEAQLRLMHLQSQEKLQQLQEMLINTENHGSNQEHQLRRQVELLEYKLQQEKSIASDLQASLKSEQEKASEIHTLLKQQHTAIFDLKSDLCESKQANEKLQKSLQELQKEVVKYSSDLESKENTITAILQDLQNEKLKEKELQNMLDDHQQQNTLREDEKSKAIEELQAALELQCIQNNQLSVALEHEQSANSNLRKELQIEHSRCEALLSQEQNKLLELQKTIEVEKNRNLELLGALNHERLLTEQLSMKINECGSCKHKGSLRELQAQLSLERSHTRELLSVIEKTRQHLDSKKEMDNSMQMYHEEPEKEQDLRPLRSPENRTEQAVRSRSQEIRTECYKVKELQKAQENQHEFDVHQCQNVGRIKELQQMLKDLKKQGQHFNCHKNQHKPAASPLDNNYPADSIMLYVEQQKLENIREQLLCAATYLSEFLSKTIDKTVNWPASNNEAVAALLHILELKAELLASSKPMVISTCVTNLIKESEELACQEGKHVFQKVLKSTDYEAKTPNFVMETKSTIVSSNLKMQKLYKKYLRAESFRKALVYQKKYLLLLLGGFQECEQATLSLIARMGIYPSLPDINASESRSRLFIKFRSTVRVAIAISRLKFLVKKWHKVSRKDQPSTAISPSTGYNSYHQVRPEAIKLQQPFSGDATQEDGYDSRKNLVRLTNSSPKSPQHLHDRFSTSQASSKDPDKSLTEYIAHLEVIQQRLGILMPGQSPQKEAL
nr:pericentrin isoform X2 [Anolis sagrei ordinatus]